MLRGVLISDTRDPAQRNTVFAEVGILVPNEPLHAADPAAPGRRHPQRSDQKDQSYQDTDFTTYDITLDLNTALAQPARARTRSPAR